jgi:hypothetical protein
MSKAKRTSIEVQGAAITILSRDNKDFISLTDMAKKFGDDMLIYGWMRNARRKSTKPSRPTRNA